MNNYNYSSSANSSSNIKKTPPPSSTDRKSSSTTPPPPSAPTTCVYESGVIPREDVLKLVTLLEEETGGLNTSTFASSYRKRYKGEELDFGAWGFASLVDMLKYLVDDVVLQPMADDSFLAHSRKKVPKQLLEIFEAAFKKPTAAAAPPAVVSTPAAAAAADSSIGGGKDSGRESGSPVGTKSADKNDNIDDNTSSVTSSSYSGSGGSVTGISDSVSVAASSNSAVVSDAAIMRQVRQILQKVGLCFRFWPN